MNYEDQVTSCQSWSQPADPLAGTGLHYTPITHTVPISTTPGFGQTQLELPLQAAPVTPVGYMKWPDTIRGELDIYNEAELAGALGVTSDTLAQWRHKGTGPTHIKLGKGVFYRVQDVKDWVEVS